MKYTKYTTFHCQGLNNDNKKSSLADDVNDASGGQNNWPGST